MWSALTDLVNSYAAYNRAKIQNSEHPKSQSEGPAAWFTACGTIIGALLAGVAAYVFWCQLTAMEQANRDSHDTFTSAQRSFVFAAAFPTVLVNDGQDEVIGTNVTVTWRNSGDTPSRDLKFFVDGSFDRNRRVSMAQNAVAYDRGLIGPHGEMNGKKWYVSLDEIKAAALHKGHYYLWGWAVYHDIFKGAAPHMTRFCEEFTFNNFTLADYEFRPCDKGNCADEEGQTDDHD